MKPSHRPLFVARRNYRRRRMRDGARLLPILGLFLIMLPPLQQWSEEEPRLGGQLVYLFLVWLFLILGAFLFTRQIGVAEDTPEPDEDDGA